MLKEKLYIGTDLIGLFKIGITNDENKRLKQLKTGNPNFWFLFVFDVKNAAIVELELHTRFEKKRIQGEWFALDAHDLQYIACRFFGCQYELDSFDLIINIIEKKRTAKLSDFRGGR